MTNQEQAWISINRGIMPKEARKSRQTIKLNKGYGRRAVNSGELDIILSLSQVRINPGDKSYAEKG